MGHDQNERRRQREADKPKVSTKHPIAAIEKRAIDSPAFARLPASAVVVLLLLARNLEKARNGHVFLSADDAERHGVDNRTLYRSLKALTAAGFIYPTSRGGHGRCARFALTWLPLSKDTRDLHVENFKPCAWRDRDEDPIARKNRRGKLSASTGQKSLQPSKLADKNTARVQDIFPYVELNTNSRQQCAAWMPAHLARLAMHGLAGKQCFRLPPVDGLN